MYEIVKTYAQTVPAMRFIGIKYGEDDRENGGFGAKWGEWFEKDRFSKLETLLTDEFKASYEDSDAYIGLMRWKEGEKFEYWIGMFVPEEAMVPEGYSYVDMSASKLGVCWIHGPEGELYCKEEECMKELSKAGYEATTDEKGVWWCFERYVCPRFTTPDEEEKLILDMCFFIK